MFFKALYQRILQGKVVAVLEKFYHTDAMLTDYRKGPNFKLWRTYTQFVVNGFHGRGYHKPGSACRRALCGNKCTKYLRNYGNRMQSLDLITADC
jgi:hypothetical protein